MSKTRTIRISPRPGSTSFVDVHVFPTKVEPRMCIGAYTGDAAMFLYPTDDEAHELIAALQWALEQREAEGVAA